jgi:predicted regulator of Ras-like GTPase activity (Roadblock/LC7/MglB family)
VFDEVVEGILGEIEGAQCVILAGRDGVVVAKAVAKGGPAPDVVAASLADLFRKVTLAHRDAGLDLPREFSSAGPHGQAALREVTSQYLLLAVLDGAGSLGRARFALSKAAEALEGEL